MYLHVLNRLCKVEILLSVTRKQVTLFNAPGRSSASKVSVIMHGDPAVSRKKVTILFAVSVFLIHHAHTGASPSFLHYHCPMSTTNILQRHPG